MRRTSLVALLLTLPAAALAQDPPPRLTGTMLYEALPSQADLAVDAPDLPTLLESASKAGLGEAGAWRAAFDAQLRAWGAGSAEPERLVRGGDALLAAADGEALLAALDIKVSEMSRTRTRATLLALRTTRDEKTLRAGLADFLAGGLKQRYEGEPRDEQIAGRNVTTLPGNDAALYLVIQNGLVVVCDHPLGLGLFLRGLADDKKAAANRPPVGRLKLIVRHGRDDAAWEGYIWGDGETAQWTTDKTPAVAMTDKASATAVVAVALGPSSGGGVPLTPVPTPKLTDGAYVVIPPEEWPTPPTGDAAFPAAAWRLGWLRAMSAGRVAPSFPAIDSALLRGPFDSAAKAAGDKAGEFLPWKSSGPGKLSGPLGHGPATFLALRVLHDIGHGIPPVGEPEAPPPPVERPSIPLPPPVEPKDR